MEKECVHILWDNLTPSQMIYVNAVIMPDLQNFIKPYLKDLSNMKESNLVPLCSERCECCIYSECCIYKKENN